MATPDRQPSGAQPSISMKSPLMKTAEADDEELHSISPQHESSLI